MDKVGSPGWLTPGWIQGGCLLCVNQECVYTGVTRSMPHTCVTSNVNM